MGKPNIEMLLEGLDWQYFLQDTLYSCWTRGNEHMVEEDSDELRADFAEKLESLRDDINTVLGQM